MKYALTYLFLLAAAALAAQVGTDTVMLQSVEKVEAIVTRDQTNSTLTDLKYLQSKRVSEALSELSSVYIKNYGNGQLASIAIRGTTASQTEVQWNGIRMNAPTLGQVDLSLFTLGTQDELNISLTGGKGVIGGVLQMNNRARYNNGIALEGSVRFGSFKTLQVYTGMHYGMKRISGSTRFNYLTAANNFKYRNDFKQGRPYQTQHNAGVALFSFLQQLNIMLNSVNELHFYLWLSEADRQIPPIASKPDSKENQQDEAIRVMAQWQRKRRSLELAFTTAYFAEKLRYVNAEANLNSLTRTRVARNVFSADYLLAKQGIALKGEINYDYEFADNAAYGINKYRHLAGLKLYVDYYVKGFKLHGGFRQDTWNRQFSPFAPELSLSYNKVFKQKHSISAKLSASRNFRFPTFNDLYWVPGGNPDLKTEKSWNGNLHLLYTVLQRLTFSANGFCIYADDWIQWIPQGSNWSAVNYKRVLSRGFEAAVNVTNTIAGEKKFKVDFKASYSFTKTTNLDGASQYDQSKGKQLIYVPLHSVVAGLQLQYRRFYIRSTNNYVSTLYTSTDNSQSLKGFFIANVEVGKDFVFGTNEVGMAFRVNNIGNADYQSVAQRPMPGRAYEGIIRFKFATK